MPGRRVIVRLVGGLGNQLFAYAAARRLAIKNDAELVLDTKTGFARDVRYGRSYELGHFQIGGREATAWERLEPFSRLRRAAKRWRNASRPFPRRTYFRQTTDEYDPRILDLEVTGTTYIEGYWQSQRYFLDIQDRIRQDIRLKEEPDHESKVMAGNMQDTESVAVHFRFFEAPRAPRQLNNVGYDYYRRAFDLIDGSVRNPRFYIFSDRVDHVRRYLPQDQERFTIVGTSPGKQRPAHIDLWLMTRCKHFIIANSTFSWWGAWLADHPEKKVIAPDLKRAAGSETGVITSWGFEGLIPENWQRI